MPPTTFGSPAKKQSKWSPEEDAQIINLRGSGMKWDDISKRLPGRSSLSCRLRYQNYLERRSEWDEERKNKLARLYDRFKLEMWAKVAKEMQVPWRAAEAMHWQLGETEMARRAGVVPFSLNMASNKPQDPVTPSEVADHSLPLAPITSGPLIYGGGGERPSASGGMPLPSMATMGIDWYRTPIYTSGGGQKLQSQRYQQQRQRNTPTTTSPIVTTSPGPHSSLLPAFSPQQPTRKRRANSSCYIDSGTRRETSRRHPYSFSQVRGGPLPPPNGPPSFATRVEMATEPPHEHLYEPGPGILTRDHGETNGGYPAF